MNTEALKNKAALLAMAILMAGLCAGCVIPVPGPTLTPNEQAAINYAEHLNLPSEVREIQNPCVIIPDSPIDKVDRVPVSEFSIPGKSVVFLPPGKHTLVVIAGTGMTTGHSNFVSSGHVGVGMSVSSSTGPSLMQVELNCEKGKHYNLKRKGLIIFEYVPTEITDANALQEVNQHLHEYALHIEKAKAAAELAARQREQYLSFSKQHPNLLDGKWIHEEVILEFIGNKVKCAGSTTPMLFSRTPSFDGRFLFNEDTIIFMWDNYNTAVKNHSWTKENHPSFFPEKVAWYYHLNGDTLEIKHIGFSLPLVNSKGPVPNLSGTYQRVK